MNNAGVSDIKLLAKRAHEDKDFMNSLFALVFGGVDVRESSNAAWALTHLPQSDNEALVAYRDQLVDVAIGTPSVTLRRLSMVLLERIEWSADDVRTDFLDFCLSRIMSPQETYGVRALAIKLAYKMCRHYPELKAELKQSLLFMEREQLGRGVLHTRNKILKLL